LRGAEKIGRQFSAAHMVEKVFLGFETLAFANISHSQSAVKSAISVIHEDGVIHRLNNTGLLCHPGQILVVLLHLSAQQQARLVFLQRLIIGIS
jgi:hypothetical protein